MNLVFVGDVHGKIAQLLEIVSPQPDKQFFQLGDMGLGFQGVHLPHLKNLRFIRGNHDSPKCCLEHPQYAGHFGYLEDERLFYLGGAWSIDADWRTPDVSWWQDEELSYKDLDGAYQLYVKVKPRIVATHEAPSRAAWHMLAEFGEWRKSQGGVYVPHPHCPTDENVRVKGDEYAYYKAKLGCVNTRTSQVLQRMFEEWQPEYWLFGHYHLDRTFKIGRTEFCCLNELSTKEIVLSKDEQQETDKAEVIKALLDYKTYGGVQDPDRRAKEQAKETQKEEYIPETLQE